MTHRFRRQYSPLIKKVVPVVLLIVLLVIAAKVFVWSKQFMDATGLTPIALLRLALDTGLPLKSSDDRTNILILGIGGGTHAGADLTDTMMIFSIDNKNKQMAMISIPRDIWSDTLKDRINSAYHYGEEKKTGGGMILSRVVVEDVVGLPVHYAMLIDFSGFEDVIDLVGGVTVSVPKAFTDKDFPIAGKEEDLCDGDPEYRCRYQAVSFGAGVQNMSGEQALTYVRSRHAEGEEGSDFARSRRQQDLMVALKEKLITPDVYLSPAKVGELMRAFDKATETDLRVGELATVGKIISRIPQDKIVRISLEDELEAAPLWLYGRYALVPIESWDQIHTFVGEKLQ